MTTKESPLSQVIDAILAVGGDERREVLQRISGFKAVQDAVSALENYRIDEFRFGVLFTFDELIESIIEAATDNSSAQFLFRHIEFVESHLDKMFERFEGRGSCADKTSTVIKALARYYMTGEEISFNYDQEYVFHLPKKILASHVEIEAYFESLQHLYYGSPEKYLEQLAHITSAVAEKDGRETGSI